MGTRMNNKDVCHFVDLIKVAPKFYLLQPPNSHVRPLLIRMKATKDIMDFAPNFITLKKASYHQL